MAGPQLLNSELSLLKDHLSKRLNPIIPSGSKIVYPDFPVHTNIGDLMIYLGTEKWIEARTLRVRNRWHIDNFPFPFLEDDCAVLLHGGGNFGDLYAHQAFRERVVEAYPKNRIVFLPQSIYYRNEDKLKIAAAKFSRHADLHIFLRDHLSMNLAKRYLGGCNVYLAPDMAAFLYPLEETTGLKREKPVHRAICLARRDIEYAGEPPEDLREDWRGDWKDLLGWRVLLIRMFQLNEKLRMPFPVKRYADLWRKTANYLVRYCASRFSKSEFINTSRLHGHILAALLGIENRLYDNISGKNSSYFNTWHKDITIGVFSKR